MIPTQMDSSEPVVIAEVGTNHNRTIEEAELLVRGAAAAGCDYVKFQIYEADEIVNSQLTTADYSWEEQYGSRSLRSVFSDSLSTPKEWFPRLADTCRDSEIGWGATVHGVNGLEWAQTAQPDFLKIASMDHTNTPLLESMARSTSVPILISFGMALDIDDIARAVAAMNSARDRLVLFYCCAVYPALPSDLRLTNIQVMREEFALPVGFSDHTIGFSEAVHARELGATHFEKHVTRDRTQDGPDHSFAADLDELAAYVSAVKGAGQILSRSETRYLPPSQHELANRELYLKSIVAARDLPVGACLGPGDIYMARPGTGIPPYSLDDFLGRRLVRPVAAESLLHFADFDMSCES